MENFIQNILVLAILMKAHFTEYAGSHRATWQLEKETETKLAGLGEPEGDNAIEKLVEMGLIEELPDLGGRYRIVVSTERED